MAGTSFNYEYVLQWTLASSETGNPRILDYGSGQGQLIALALQRNVDIYGTDVPGVETSERVKLIEDGHIPFADNSFDVVVSNQVFEHIHTPQPVLAEIHRVLTPGGIFLALFPDASVWFEGHVGLYFVHWLMPYPKLLHSYLIACHKAGFGYFREGKSAAEWADWATSLIQTEVFYHPARDIEKWWTEAFGSEPESLAHDWMQFRISASRPLHRLANLTAQKWTAAPLSFICRIRAGQVLMAKKRI